MHDTAMEIGRKFFGAYLGNQTGLSILDVGAQDVNGSLRSVAPMGNEYIGVDFIEGKGVDVVITDPYSLPFSAESFDVVVCSSCFEHSEFFWLLFSEIQRVLKKTGVFYLNVPSNGNIHKYPVDCWRFYPDSGVALQNWARREGYRTTLVESFTSLKKDDVWNDFVAVFVKDADHLGDYTGRIQESYLNFYNGVLIGCDAIINPRELQEDQLQFIQTSHDLAEVSAQLADMALKYNEIKHSLELLESEIKHKEDLHKKSINTLEEKAASLNSRIVSLNSDIDLLHRERQLILNSYSWRLTAPLRWCRRWLKVGGSKTK